MDITQDCKRGPNYFFPKVTSTLVYLYIMKFSFAQWADYESNSNVYYIFL